MESFKNKSIEQLKTELRKHVSRFCSKDSLVWKEPILQTFQEIKKNNWNAVIFGGTVRSLMLGYRSTRRPRDVDIVLTSVDVDRIKSAFSDSFVRKTRFGGVKLQKNDMEFDIWPVDRTWAYVADNTSERTYVNLPKTTFLNIEAIAVDVWPKARGNERKIYTDNDSFFKSILSQTLEINREENPFPSLCVVRSLIMAASLKFRIGPRLSEFIVKYGSVTSTHELEEVQKKHYGKVKVQGCTLFDWIEYINREKNNSDGPISLPMSYKQRNLWAVQHLDGKPQFHFYIADDKN